MQLIRGLHNLQARRLSASVATLGTFDGVHLGHQAVLRELSGMAQQTGLPSVVILFEPQPAEFFAAATAPARLTSLREKCRVLAGLEIDYVCCLRFDQRLANLEATDFIQQILVDGLGIQHLVVGHDLRFGKARKGDIHLLRDVAEGHGFAVDQAGTWALEGERVSSTRIRELLANGEMRAAEAMLGRPYSLCGRVVHGQKLAREMSFPTANIALNRHVSAVDGIFAARVLDLEDRPLDAVAYVGRRPIIEDNRKLLEVHIFDYQQDFYGRHLQVELHDKLRDDLPFDSLQALQQQIAKDIQQAKEFLSIRVAQATC